MPQRHIQRTNAAADWRGERSLNGHAKIANSVDGIVRQPFVERLERFFPGEHFKPSHAPLAAVGLLDRRVKYAPRRLPNVTSRSITLDERNDGRVRYLQFAGGAPRRHYFFASRQAWVNS